LVRRLQRVRRGRLVNVVPNWHDLTSHAVLFSPGAGQALVFLAAVLLVLRDTGPDDAFARRDGEWL
jgi:hypothetical protein